MSSGSPTSSPVPHVDSRFHTFAVDAWTPRWSSHNARGALLCLPVIALSVFLGIASHRHRWAVYAVAGAFTMGLGAFQQLGCRTLLSRVVLLAGITIVTFTGCVTAHVGWPVYILVSTTGGYGFGAMTLLGYGGWWTGLHWMIALLVYGSHPFAPAAAAACAAALLAGGASQLLVLTAVQPLAKTWFRHQPQPPFDSNEALLSALKRNLNPRSSSSRYTVRIAVAMAVGSTVAHLSHVSNGYWIPMTAVILLKPKFYETTVRGVNRVLGTLIGGALTTVVLATFRPGPNYVGAALLAMAWASFAVQRVNYALFAACVTSYVVLLFSIQGLPEMAVTEHRIVATIAGATIALLVWLPLPHPGGGKVTVSLPPAA